MSGPKIGRSVIRRDVNEPPWECHFFRSNPLKQVFWTTVGVMSVGFLFLVFFWRKDWRLLLTHDQTSSIQKATSVLVKMADGRTYVSVLAREQIPVDEKCLIEGPATTLLGGSENTEDGLLVYFHLQKIKYIWNDSLKEFFILRGIQKGIKCSEFHEKYKQGLNDQDVKKRFEFFGENTIMVKVKPIFVMLFQEALHPFYVFQAFSVTVWCFNDYVLYAVVILAISIVSISISLFTTRTQLTTLKKMVASHTSIKVLRDGEEVDIPESEAVPGDVMIIPWGGCTLTCDAVLITGNCVVNESMLTGESVPVTKTSLPQSKKSSEVYDTAAHLRHTLLCGTKVIQTRSQERLLAVVTNTGFATMKGKLVHSILYPVPSSIKLYRDAVYFVLVLACFAAGGFIYDAIILSTVHKASTRDIIFSSADVITIAVAPALPAALTIGMVYAQLRLKNAGIFCINPSKINLCGMVDVICFDKTGTLTEDGLDFLGIHEVVGKRLSGLVKTLSEVATSPAISVLASCHTLTHIDGELVGDPLDLKMFLATGWTLMEPSEDKSQANAIAKRLVFRHCKGNEANLEILKLFPFVSSLQRMTVLARSNRESLITVYTKGAPEKIASLSNPQTVPLNFEEILERHTEKGFRVIGLATKELAKDVSFTDADQIDRAQLECGLTFVGLMVMQNQLKPETAGVFYTLHSARNRTIMVTVSTEVVRWSPPDVQNRFVKWLDNTQLTYLPEYSDNILTAVHIAQESGMFQQCKRVYHMKAEKSTSSAQKAGMVTHKLLEPIRGNEKAEEVLIPMASAAMKGFVTDGTSFDIIREKHPHELETLLEDGVVFARMTPNQKMQLVVLLQQRQMVVAMCGDGANDCGALKTAHVGVALSEEEASVAAPFTSKVQNISCVPRLLREGRAALTTSFAAFKFMALYSMIQFTSVIVLNSVQLYLGNVQFLYIDIFLSIVLVMCFARSPANPKLTSVKPPTKLISAPIIISFASHTTIQAVFQVIPFLLVQRCSWYQGAEEFQMSTHYPIHSYENTSVFVISCFQYLLYSLIFSNGAPYRKPIYTNYLYMLSVICLFTISVVMICWPMEWMLNIFELVAIPDWKFRISILVLFLLNAIISYVLEFHLLTNRVLRRFCSKFMCMQRRSLETVATDTMEEGCQTNETEMDLLI